MLIINSLYSRKLKLLVEGLSISLKLKDNVNLSEKIQRQYEEHAGFYLKELAIFVGGFDDVENQNS